MKMYLTFLCVSRTSHELTLPNIYQSIQGLKTEVAEEVGAIATHRIVPRVKFFEITKEMSNIVTLCV
jgi:hypothetical protein